MAFVKTYLIPRLIHYFLVLFLGLTAVFVLPRLMPLDPVEEQIAQYQAFGAYIPPERLEQIINTLRELYGLKGTLLQQYTGFWRRLFTGDFGPSLAQYPTPVSELIASHLPWTIGLLSLTAVFSWIIAVLVGGIAGYYRGQWAEILDDIVMLIRPIPYYIMAIICLIFFGYIIPLFPLGGGMGIGREFSFNLETIGNILLHGTLPALTLIIVGVAWQFQSMKLIVQTVRAEDYVRYAEAAGVKKRIIAFRYIIRNAMLPMVTQLGLQFGFIFSGALITEMVFTYPGVGLLLYNAVVKADYNLIMGILVFSVVAVATSILFLDLLYPLVDPRIRYK